MSSELAETAITVKDDAEIVADTNPDLHDAHALHAHSFASATSGIREYCLIFPTVGHPMEGDENKWVINVRGWVYALKANSIRKRLIVGIGKRLLRHMIRGNQEMEENLAERLEMTFVTRTSPVTINVHLDGPILPTIDDPYPYEVRTDEDANQHDDDDDFSDEDDGPTSPKAKSPRMKSPPLKPAKSPSLKPKSEEKTLTPEKEEDLLIKLPSASSPPPLPPRKEDKQVATDANGLVQQITAQDNGHWSGEFIVDKSVVEKWKQSEAFKQCGHLYLKIHVEREGQPYDSYGTVELLDSEGVSVISDIDDTIKLSNVHLGAKEAVINGLIKNPEEVPGMSRVYRSLWTKGASMHYVSASPWQIFPVLVGFFRSCQFPPGSAHLRIVALMDRQSLKEKSSVKKRISIRQLLETFPKRKFIMVGDSGEDDMLTYADMARAFPSQVAAIFIRDVTGISDNSPLLTDEALKEMSEKPLPPPPKSPEPEGGEKKPKEEDTRPEDVRLAERLQTSFHGLDYSLWKIFTDPLVIRNNSEVLKTLHVNEV